MEILGVIPVFWTIPQHLVFSFWAIFPLWILPEMWHHLITKISPNTFHDSSWGVLEYFYKKPFSGKVLTMGILIPKCAALLRKSKMKKTEGEKKKKKTNQWCKEVKKPKPQQKPVFQKLVQVIVSTLSFVCIPNPQKTSENEKQNQKWNLAML